MDYAYTVLVDDASSVSSDYVSCKDPKDKKRKPNKMSVVQDVRAGESGTNNLLLK